MTLTEEQIEAARRITEAPIFENLSDAGNARRFITQHGHRVRWSAMAGHWLIWSGLHWQKDSTGEVMRLAKATARSILTEAGQEEDEAQRRRLARFAITSENEARLKSMISLARSEPGIAVTPDQLDADPLLLTCQNGTIDLRTGKLSPARPEDLITRRSFIEYDPDAKCPRFLRFLSEIYDGDSELVRFEHLWIGYSLTGETREHALRIDYGPEGRNGKTTLAEIKKELLGDHATSASFESFLRKRGEGPRNDLARLAGSRLVLANESGKGRRIDEATVKSHTGGDTVVARFLYGEIFEFKPTYKIELITNDRPRIDGGDEAIWARIREVPFRVSFRGREDKTLIDTLQAELPGILAWAVRGCLLWQKEGLGTAAAIEEATQQYRADEDIIGAFLDQSCDMEGQVETATLRDAYENFCRDAGEEPLSGARLGRELSHRGITRGGSGRRFYIGVSVK